MVGFGGGAPNEVQEQSPKWDSGRSPRNLKKLTFAYLTVKVAHEHCEYAEKSVGLLYLQTSRGCIPSSPASVTA